MNTLEYLLQDRRMMAQGRPLTLKRLFEDSLPIQGDVVEIGCNEGRAGALLQCIMDEWGIADKKLYLYDSFEGLPAPTEVDGEGALIREGAFAVGEEVVLKTFSDLDLKPPIICKGWFRDTLPTQLPDKICFSDQY